MLQISTLVFVIATTFATEINAATIAVVPGKFDKEYYVSISGTIEKGDSNKFAMAAWEAIMVSQSNLTVVLDSDGGDVEEAMLIGSLTRELLASTEVHGVTLYRPGTPAGNELEELAGLFQSARYGLRPIIKNTYAREDIAQCVSACILIFFAGTNRVVWDNSLFGTTMQMRSAVPSIGIHRPRYDQQAFGSLEPLEASIAYNMMEDNVRIYMLQMGAPNTLIDRMFEIPSYEVEFYGADDFSRYFVSTAPFLEEWIAARCGSPAMMAHLTPAEADIYELIFTERTAALKRGEISTSEYDGYFPTGITPKVGQDILDKVKNESLNFARCSFQEIRQRQRDWAFGYSPE